MRNADVAKMFEIKPQADILTRGNSRALATLDRWARLGFEEGQTEEERREDIAVSEEPKIDDQMIADLPGELNV